MTISQETFDALMALEKRFSDDKEISLADGWTRDIDSINTKDKFQLDYRHSKIEIRKYSFNHRTRVSVVLLRYCAQKRHTNPDGKVFDGPHLHLFCEGYDDKIAFSVKDILDIDPLSATKEEMLEKILEYCHIAQNKIQTTMELEI